MKNDEFDAVTCSVMSWERIVNWLWFYPIFFVVYVLCAFYVKSISEVKRN